MLSALQKIELCSVPQINKNSNYCFCKDDITILQFSKDIVGLVSWAVGAFATRFVDLSLI